MERARAISPRPASWPLVALLFVGCASSAPTSAPVSPPDGAQLTAVMEAIQQSLSESETRDVPGFPPLKSVTVKLQTEAGRSAGGKVELYVFSVGSRYTAETASTLELKMKPPAGRGPKGALPEDLKQALARAIHLAKLGVVQAAQGSPPFVMAEIEIDLKFTVEVSGTAGAKVSLVPLGAEVGGKLNRNQVHAVTLLFGQ